MTPAHSISHSRNGLASMACRRRVMGMGCKDAPFFPKGEDKARCPTSVHLRMPYHNSLERLRHIMGELRTRCPWDKKQTIQTLRQLTIEETYELAGAITEED